MKSSELVRILLYPIANYDRRRDVEPNENNGYTIHELETALPQDVEVYSLTDFMDLCNDVEFNPYEYWVSYCNLIEDKEPPTKSTPDLNVEHITIISEVTAVDVASVAKDLNKSLTDEQIQNIVTEYPNRVNSYAIDDNWTYIVEDMIYGLLPPTPTTTMTLLATSPSDLTFSDPKDNEHLCEDNEAIGVLNFGIFWIIIVNNPKGTYRVDDGWNTEYTNSIDEAIRLMNKFISNNQ